MTPIDYGSVCSGIEAASLAWEPLGFKPSWFAEIEKFPSAVLSHHWPEVPNLGDMTILKDAVAYGLIHAPEVLVGGTPCQAFSIAGMRQGLDDERGQLTIEYVRLADAIDKARGPGRECVTVWENVEGVLSDNNNAFGCFLGALAGDSQPLEPAPRPDTGRSNRWWRWNKKHGSHVPKWAKSGCVHGPKRTIAWRLLDAQYFGVAQRRRRVFVVSSARDGINPGKILFESEGVRRDSPPSRETGQEVTGDAGGGSQNASASLTTRCGEQTGNDAGANLVCMAHGQGGAEIRSDGEPSLTCNHEAPIIVAFSGADAGRDAREDNLSPPLRACNSVNSNQSGMGQAVAVSLRGRKGGGTAELGGGVSPALRASSGGGDKPHVLSDLEVRRLMPVECERLQGDPDNHTRISWRGKAPEDCPDGPRYKAVGNSKAVPVVKWLGLRLLKELRP